MKIIIFCKNGNFELFVVLELSKVNHSKGSTVQAIIQLSFIKFIIKLVRSQIFIIA